MIDAVVLKLPILGILMRKIAVARFCRTLSTLLASGVAILEALEITARTAGNATRADGPRRDRSLGPIGRSPCAGSRLRCAQPRAPAGL